MNVFRRCALLLLLAAACGGNGGNDGGVTPPEDDAGANAGPDGGVRPVRDAGTPDAGYTAVAVGDFCALRAKATCERKVRCLELGAAALADCVTTQLRGCDQAAYDFGAANGTLGFDTAVAAACVNGYYSGACLGEPTVCASVVVGQQTESGACVLNAECAAGTFCNFAEGTCPAHCRTFAAPGAECSNGNTQCDPAKARCGYDAGSYYCLPYVPLGQPCQDYYACAPGAGCGSGTCMKTQAELGEACAVVNGSPGCKPEAFCRQDPPPPGSTDFPPGTCEARVGLGGTCAGSYVCASGLHCTGLFQTGTCQPLGGAGDICNAQDDCREEVFCDMSRSRCVPLPGDGGDCGYQAGGSDFRCAAGYSCVYSGSWRCQRLSGLGETCPYGDNSSCVSNACEYGPLNDGGTDYRCVPPCSQTLDGGL